MVLSGDGKVCGTAYSQRTILCVPTQAAAFVQPEAEQLFHAMQAP